MTNGYRKVCAKTCLTFASCYCFWNHGFNPLQKFPWKVDVTHFVLQFCQRPMTAVVVITLTCIKFVSDFEKQINRNPTSLFQAQNCSPLFCDPQRDEHDLIHEVVNKTLFTLVDCCIVCKALHNATQIKIVIYSMSSQCLL